MSTRYMKLPTKASNGVKYAYIPDANSQAARRTMQKDWEFRLNAEFTTLKKRGWNLAFMTLTYSNEQLPHIPKEIFKDGEEYRSIPCFSRSDVQEFIHSIRHYCKYHFKFTGEKAVRYFVSCEYGSETHRPHYHAILAWDSSVSYETMHALCSHYWNHGILFPRDPRGDINMLPFEIVGDVSSAVSYCSKYVCKDLDFAKAVANVQLMDKTRVYKNCCSFHLQSKSLGYSFISSMSDREKWEAYSTGVSFQGDGYIYRIPLYIKNKLIFDNDYIVTASGKRLVRRKATEFFHKHRADIFRQKARFYEKTLRGSTTAEWYTQRGIPQDQAKSFQNAILSLGERVNAVFGFDLVNSGHLGEYYLTYFGIAHDQCRAISSEKEAIDCWYSRYSPTSTAGLPKLDFECWKALQDYFSLVLGCNTFCNLNAEYEQFKSDTLKAQILDYFNNVLGPRL